MDTSNSTRNSRPRKRSPSNGEAESSAVPSTQRRKLNDAQWLESKIHLLFESNRLLKKQNVLLKKQADFYKDKYLKQRDKIAKIKAIFSVTNRRSKLLSDTQSGPKREKIQKQPENKTFLPQSPQCDPMQHPIPSFPSNGFPFYSSMNPLAMPFHRTPILNMPAIPQNIHFLNNHYQQINVSNHLIASTLTTHSKQSKNCIRILLDANNIGAVIGKSGETINELSRISNAKITTDGRSTSLFRICYVQGHVHHVINAIQLIADEIARKRKGLLPYHIVIAVKYENIKCTIKETVAETTANIVIGSQLVHNQQMGTIDIHGNRESVHSAISIIVQRLLIDPNRQKRNKKTKNPKLQSRQRSNDMQLVTKDWLESITL